MRWLALLLVALAGCASAPEASTRPVTVGSSGLVDLGRATAAEVDAFAQRLASHAGRPACQRALAERYPDLALALFRRALTDGDPALIATVGPLTGELDSLEAARRDPARSRAAWQELAHAEAARAAGGSGEQAEVARRAFLELGDRLGVAEARLVLATDDAEPELVSSGSEARLLLVRASRLRPEDAARSQRLYERALRYAGGSRDGALVLLVEAQRAELAGTLEPVALGAWLRHVGELALDRGHPLVALRAAFEAREVPDGKAGQARALAARAQLALGQSALALETALELAETARSNGDAILEGLATSIVGEALLASDRDGDAAGAFERAAHIAERTGDQDSAARRTLNAARAHLRRGDPAAAKTCIEAVERAAFEGSRTAARAALVRALELTHRKEYARARDTLEVALAVAAAQGDFETVEQCSVLKKRLGDRGT